MTSINKNLVFIMNSLKQYDFGGFSVGIIDRSDL
jgi:hypothetical protein